MSLPLSSPYKRLLLLAGLILTGLTLCRVLYCHDWLTLESIQKHFHLLTQWRNEHYWLAVGLFVLVYVAATTLSLPVGALLTLTGGALFGYAGVVYVALASALGAVTGALTTRFFLRGFLESHCRQPVEMFNTALREHKITYLLHVRLTPIYPFFLVNMLAGVSRVDMWSFFWTTALGTLPGDIAYTAAGHELSQLSSLEDAFNPGIFTALVFLGLVSVAPKLLGKWLQKSPSSEELQIKPS